MENWIKSLNPKIVEESSGFAPSPEDLYLVRKHRDLGDKLALTSGLIIEASPVDPIWGEGPTSTGLNLMGLLLMELREALREARK